MKKITLILAGLAYTALLYSQQKLSVSLFADNFYGFTQHSNDHFSTFEYSEVSRTENAIILAKRQFDYSLGSSTRVTAGFSVGSKILYPLNKFLSLSAGIGFTSFQAERKNVLVNTPAATTQLTIDYTAAPGDFISLDLPKTGFESLASYYYYVKTERFHFNAIKLPIGFQLRPAGSKLGVSLEMVPVVIIHYSVTATGNTNPEAGLMKSATTENKWNFSGSLGVDYAITGSLSANLFYQQYFNSLANGKINPGINPATIGASLIYKIKH